MMHEAANQALEYIRTGGIILYPTDTIWGIGCDATNSIAVRKIYTLKQRSDSKSMLVLVNGLEMLARYLVAVPGEALKTLESATKPTTIIYPGSRGLANNLPAPDGSIGIRVTDDPFCMKLIGLMNRPLVSTSANLSGHPHPGTFGEIPDSLKRGVDHVVDWRQEESTTAAPSAILKVDPGGNILPVRP